MFREIPHPTIPFWTYSYIRCGAQRRRRTAIGDCTRQLFPKWKQLPILSVSPFQIHQLSSYRGYPPSPRQPISPIHVLYVLFVQTLSDITNVEFMCKNSVDLQFNQKEILSKSFLDISHTSAVKLKTDLFLDRTNKSFL